LRLAYVYEVACEANQQLQFVLKAVEKKSVADQESLIMAKMLGKYLCFM
jgi:hypothetical protein